MKSNGSPSRRLLDPMDQENQMSSTRCYLYLDSGQVKCDKGKYQH